MLSPYYDLKTIKNAVDAGDHRSVIGGFWDEIGKLQMDFLLAQGLNASTRFLDIGCGSLRLGKLAIEHLASAHYFGVDISEELLQAGYDRELPPALQAKLPRSHLVANGVFDFSFLPQPVDMALAQSVFTHLPLNHTRRCLRKLHPHMTQGGAFYATILLCPQGKEITETLVQGSEANNTAVTSYDFQDPYHYTLEDIEFCIKGTPWKLEFIGNWNHPRSLQMLKFIKQ